MNDRQLTQLQEWGEVCLVDTPFVTVADLLDGCNKLGIDPSALEIKISHSEHFPVLTAKMLSGKPTSEVLLDKMYRRYGLS